MITLPSRLAASLLTLTAALSIGCGTEIICESGANCATGGGGSGASGGTGGTGGSGASGGIGGTGGTGGTTTTSVGGSGGGVDFSDYCEDLCACDPQLCDEGNGFALEECYETVDNYIDEAMAAGCYEELVVLDACLDESLCQGGMLQPPPCMDSAVLDVEDCMYGAPPPPSNTICDQAAIICGGEPEPGAECVGMVVCLASCIVDANACDPDTAQTCIDACQ